MDSKRMYFRSSFLLLFEVFVKDLLKRTKKLLLSTTKQTEVKKGTFLAHIFNIIKRNNCIILQCDELIIEPKIKPYILPIDVSILKVFF